MNPDLTDDRITATCEVRHTVFARFGVSGWYWWNGVAWGALPSPLHIEPMLDAIVARNAENDRLRAAGAALYLLLDEMHKCGRRQPGLTEALEGWEAATKEDDRAE